MHYDIERYNTMQYSTAQFSRIQSKSQSLQTQYQRGSRRMRPQTDGRPRHGATHRRRWLTNPALVFYRRQRFKSGRFMRRGSVSIYFGNFYSSTNAQASGYCVVELDLVTRLSCRVFLSRSQRTLGNTLRPFKSFRSLTPDRRLLIIYCNTKTK